MQIMKCVEQFEVVEGKPKLLRTVILYGNDRQLFIAHIPRRVYAAEERSLDPSALDGFPIPSEHVYPIFDERRFTVYHTPNLRECYLKKPNLITYKFDGTKHTHLKELMVQEAEVCEVLMKKPHPNIATYLGCQLNDGRVVALCFEKYSETLYERARVFRGDADKGLCLEGIRQGIQHLHSLGYCHNDINPGNIMFRENDTPVIIDFDSCRKEGQRLGYKAGTPGFDRDWINVSEKENDYYGLSRIEAFLEEDVSCVDMNEGPQTC